MGCQLSTGGVQVGVLLLVKTSIPRKLREQSSGQFLLTRRALARSNHEMTRIHSPRPAWDIGDWDKRPYERHPQVDLDVRNFVSHEAVVSSEIRRRCSQRSRLVYSTQHRHISDPS